MKANKYVAVSVKKKKKVNDGSIDLPLISMRGYALKSEEVRRMRSLAEKELNEIRKELGYQYG